MKKLILMFAVLLGLILPASAWAKAETDLYRVWKRYAAEYGVEKITKSEAEALKKRAQRDPAESARLGVFHYQEKRYKEAFDAISRSADGGHTDGILLKGVAYLTETGTKSRDKGRGVGFVRRAAQQGHPVAQYLMGSLYEDGYQVERNPREALDWLELAAERGMDSEALTDQGRFAQVLAKEKKSESATVSAESPTASGQKPETVNPVPVPGAKIKTPLKEGMNKIIPKKKNYISPSADGVSLAKLESAWSRLSGATGLNAYLVYDDEDVLNAYITKNKEGDFIVVVYRGLLNILRAEDEIAGVLGHEIGHGVNNHLEKGATNQVGINVAANVLSRLLGKNAIADVALGAGAELAKSGYSREAEVEADDFGTEYSARAGYSAWGLYNSVKRMADAGAVTPPSGFNSHPPTERRMKRLKEKAERWENELHRGR